MWQRFDNQYVESTTKYDRIIREEKWHFSEGDLRFYYSLFAAGLITKSYISKKY